MTSAPVPTVQEVVFEACPMLRSWLPPRMEAFACPHGDGVATRTALVSEPWLYWAGGLFFAGDAVPDRFCAMALTKERSCRTVVVLWRHGSRRFWLKASYASVDSKATWETARGFVSKMLVRWACRRDNVIDYQD